MREDEDEGNACQEEGKAGTEEGASELVEVLRVRVCSTGSVLTGRVPGLQTKVRVHRCNLLYAGMRGAGQY